MNQSHRSYKDEAELEPELPVQLNEDPFVPIEILLRQNVGSTRSGVPSNTTRNREIAKSIDRTICRYECLDRSVEKSDVLLSDVLSERNRRLDSLESRQTSSLTVPPVSPANPKDEKRLFEIGEFEFEVVRRKSWQLINRYGFRRDDLNDIQQELLLRLWQASSAFDSQKSNKRSFVLTVIERSVATMIRSQKASKRDFRRTRLNADSNVPADRPIDEAESTSELNRMTRNSDQALHELSMDISTIYATLPDDLKDLVDRLGINNLSTIERQTGESRYRLLKKIRRLRRIFEDWSLESQR